MHETNPRTSFSNRWSKSVRDTCHVIEIDTCQTYLSSKARQVFEKQVKGISVTMYCFTPGVTSNQQLGDKRGDDVLSLTIVGD